MTQPASDSTATQPTTASDPRWKKVARGLGVARIGYLSLLVAAVVFFLVVCAIAVLRFAVFTEQFDISSWLQLGGAVVGLPYVFGAVGVFLGRLMCCAAPGQSGCKGWAIAALVAMIIGLPLVVAGRAMRSDWFLDYLYEKFSDNEGLVNFAFERLPFLVMGAGALVVASGMLCHMLFLRKVAEHLQSAVLAKDVTRLILFWAGGCAVLILYPLAAVAIIQFLNATVGETTLLVVFGPLLVAAVACTATFFLWLARVIAKVRQVIVAGMPRNTIQPTGGQSDAENPFAP